MEIELKFYKRIYDNERVKSDFVEGGLNNLIWILLNMNLEQNGSGKRTRLSNYHKWCANLLHFTTKIKEKTEISKKQFMSSKNQKKIQETNERNERHLKNMTEKAILNFMVENDAELSIN